MYCLHNTKLSYGTASICSSEGLPADVEGSSMCVLSAGACYILTPASDCGRAIVASGPSGQGLFSIDSFGPSGPSWVFIQSSRAASAASSSTRHTGLSSPEPHPYPQTLPSKLWFPVLQLFPRACRREHWHTPCLRAPVRGAELPPCFLHFCVWSSF